MLCFVCSLSRRNAQYTADAAQLQATPMPMPTTVSRSRSGGWCRASKLRLHARCIIASTTGQCGLEPLGLIWKKTWQKLVYC